MTGMVKDIHRQDPGHLQHPLQTEKIEGATELVKWMSGVESGVRYVG